MTNLVNDEAAKCEAPVSSFARSDRHERPVLCKRGTSRWAKATMGLLLSGALLVASASPAFADRYDKRRAGHPLRIAAYIIYPVGALLDVLIMRPAHWLVSQEPFKSAVNHED